MPSDTPNQIAAKTILNLEADESVAKLKAAADLLVAFELSQVKGKNREAEREQAAGLMMLHWAEGLPALESHARAQIGGFTPFHWALMFPEVIASGGFDAIVGNPPFIGGQLLSNLLGSDYREILIANVARNQRGSADLCAYFLLRAASLIRVSGMAGLIATNTIAEGETRNVGLAQFPYYGVRIVAAISSMVWPGAAALAISVLWLRRGQWEGNYRLDGAEVKTLSSSLATEHSATPLPHRLPKNRGMAFKGSSIQGIGFLLAPEEAESILQGDSRYRAVLAPFLGERMPLVTRTDGHLAGQ